MSVVSARPEQPGLRSAYKKPARILVPGDKRRD